MSFSMRTNGKVLLTGEYFVTDGAVALALPTQLGQSLNVDEWSEASGKEKLFWQSFDKNDEVWFSCVFSSEKLEVLSVDGGDDKDEIAERLRNILLEAKMINPDFLKKNDALKVNSKLEFNLNWGLGSSATLITLVAAWAKVDAFELLERTFGGSGYDIVTSTAEGPVIFQKFNGKNRWEKSKFDPAFKDNLYFVFLDKKQDTREALVHYKITPSDERAIPLPRITQITHDINQYTSNLKDFNELIAEHETIVKDIIKQPRAKELYFEDFWGEIKSLGGWGGDFVLATSDRTESETIDYFKSKGFDTVFKYQDFIKQNHK